MSQSQSNGKPQRRKRNLKQNVRMLPVKKLKVDHRYQRPLQEREARRIAQNFSEDLFGTLHVSRRHGRDEWYVLDGQTRLEAARSLDIDEVPCEIVACQSIAEEARIFRLLNTERKLVNSFALYKARTAEGDPAALGLAEVLEARGCSIWEQGTNHLQNFPVFMAVTSLQWVYKNLGRDVLDEALYVLISAYEKLDEYPHGCNGATWIKGLCHFIATAQREDLYDRDVLIKVIQNTLPVRFVEMASAPALYSHGRVRRIAEAIAEKYNRALGPGRKLHKIGNPKQPTKT